MEGIDPNGAYVLDGVRSPFAPALGLKRKPIAGGLGERVPGAFRHLSSTKILSDLFAHILDKNNVDPESLDDVLTGCVAQKGEQAANISRNAAVMAGIPYSVPAATDNRLCASSMQSVINAANRIWGGVRYSENAPAAFLVGGIEQMSKYSITDLFQPGPALSNYLQQSRNFSAPFMGHTAENLVDKHYLTSSDPEERKEQWIAIRQAQDQFALASHQKAVAAREKLSREIVPVDVGDGQIVDYDLGPRADTSMKSLSGLNPVFRPGVGTVTPGNASPETDGGVALLIVSGQYLLDHKLEPLAQITGEGVKGCDPKYMGWGPVPATEYLFSKMPGLSLSDVDFIELNEAFAAQSLSVIEKGWGLSADDPRINVNGGAIALGHPLGASGGRIVLTAAHELYQNPDANLAYATMCVGMGMGGGVLMESVRL